MSNAKTFGCEAPSTGRDRGASGVDMMGDSVFGWCICWLQLSERGKIR